MRDPYSILGVNRKSSPEDVKSAFRSLAKQYHPDVAGNSEAVAGTFQEINAAYDILGDETRRGKFDRGEIDASGMPVMRRQNSRSANQRAKQRETRNSERKSAAEAWAARARAGGDKSRAEARNGEDFKSYSWGARDKEKTDAGEDHGRRPRADEVFNDLFSGLKARAKEPPKFQEGETAKPSPEPQEEPRSSEPMGDAVYNLSIEFEEAARGTSRRVKLPSGKRLDVKIPAGVRAGQQIRLKGQGHQDGPMTSDAILEISVEPHRLFTCEGDDIYLILPVTVDEAVLGAKVMVPTLDGPVAMTVPAGANSDTALRLKGRGLPRGVEGADQQWGDQYVTLKVVLPTANDADFRELVKRWAEKNAYDVRADLMF